MRKNVSNSTQQKWREWRQYYGKRAICMRGKNRWGVMHCHRSLYKYEILEKKA